MVELGEAVGYTNEPAGARRHRPLKSFVIVLAIMLVSVAAVWLPNRQRVSPAAAVTEVRVVAGSESEPLLTDPRMVAAFARHGFRLDVEPEGSREMAKDQRTCGSDLALPSSEPVAQELHVTCPAAFPGYPVFFSPMAVVTFRDLIPSLKGLGIAAQDPRTALWTFDLQRYMSLVARHQRWNTIPQNTAHPDWRNQFLLTTTNLDTSNSAAMYAVMLSYVLNNYSVVTSVQQATGQGAQVGQEFFLPQGYQPPTTLYNFDEIISSLGEALTPMVVVYEAQFLDAEINHPSEIKGSNLVLMYPSPTAVANHTVVPLTKNGATVAKLLAGAADDPDITRLEAEHGWRTLDPGRAFSTVMAQHHIAAPSELTNAPPPAYPFFEALLDGI